MAGDLEEDERLGAAEDDDDAEAPPVEAEKAVSETDEGIRAELEVVVAFAARARELGHDSKARRLLDALRFIQDRGSQGLGSGKAVIFTESLTTQDYLRTLLLEHGYEPGDVTLFRGDNVGPDADASAGAMGGGRGSRDCRRRIARAARSPSGWRLSTSSGTDRRSSSRPKPAPRA